MKKVALKRPNPKNPHIRAYTTAVKNGFKVLHVSPSKDGWVVKKTHSSGELHVFETKSDAMKFGAKTAKNLKTELIVYGKDGRIRERNGWLPGSDSNRRPKR